MTGIIKKYLNKEYIFEHLKYFFKEWFIPIIIAYILYLLITNFVLFKAYIPSASMEPTLYEGDQLFVTKIYNTDKIKRGDIVVFRSEELDDILIKRVIGLPGDKIVLKDGVTTINGEVYNEDFIKSYDNEDGEYEVPEGKFFLRGDNRLDSYDSTKWKVPYISSKDIMGKAQIKIYPFNDIGSLYD